MAITEKYVSSTGAGDFSGSSEANAMRWSDLSTAMSGGGSAAAGDRYNIKAGTYSSLSAANWTATGTPASPIILRGYNSTIGDLDTQGRTSGNQALDTTNFPALNFSQGEYFRADNTTCVVFQNLNITIGGTGRSGAGMTTGITCVIFRCKVTNPSTNGSANGITAYSGAVIDCDAVLSGGSGTACGITANDYCHYINNRVVTCPSVGIIVTGGRAVCRGNVVANCGSHGIQYTDSSTTNPMVFIGNTVYGCGGSGIYLGSYAYAQTFVFIDNHLTDNTRYAIECAYSGTANVGGAFYNNRTRDNGLGAYLGFADWVTGTNTGAVTTDTGGAATDYTAAGSNDFTLISAAPGKAVGLMPYMDIGALQRQESASGGGVIGNDMDGGFA